MGAEIADDFDPPAVQSIHLTSTLENAVSQRKLSNNTVSSCSSNTW